MLTGQWETGGQIVHDLRTCDGAEGCVETAMRHATREGLNYAAGEGAARGGMAVAGKVKVLAGAAGVTKALRNAEIPWSSKSLRVASKALDDGATSVRVASRAEAEELFLGKYQGDGYKNVTGMSPVETKEFFGSKSGVYHWDEGAASFPHEGNHLQIHTFDGTVIRVYFP